MFLATIMHGYMHICLQSCLHVGLVLVVHSLIVVYILLMFVLLLA